MNNKNGKLSELLKEAEFKPIRDCEQFFISMEGILMIKIVNNATVQFILLKSSKRKIEDIEQSIKKYIQELREVNIMVTVLEANNCQDRNNSLKIYGYLSHLSNVGDVKLMKCKPSELRG